MNFSLYFSALLIDNLHTKPIRFFMDTILIPFIDDSHQPVELFYRLFHILARNLFPRRRNFLLTVDNLPWGIYGPIEFLSGKSIHGDYSGLSIWLNGINHHKSLLLKHFIVPNSFD